MWSRLEKLSAATTLDPIEIDALDLGWGNLLPALRAQLVERGLYFF